MAAQTTERIVIKMGTQIVLDQGKFAKDRLKTIVEACHELRSKKKQFIFVSSGAVGLGPIEPQGSHRQRLC